MNEQGVPVFERPELNEIEPRWIRVIGIISIIYAVLGLTCNGGATIWTLFADQFLKAMVGAEEPMPPIIRVMTFGMVALILPMGVLLIVAGVKLLRMRPGALRLLRLWVVLRLVLLVIAVAAQIIIVPAQVEYGKRIEQAAMAKARQQNGGQPMPGAGMSDEMRWTAQVVGVAVSAVIVSIYPLFLGIYLSRRRIRESEARWLSPAVHLEEPLP